MICPTCVYTCTRIVYHTSLKVQYMTWIANIFPQTCCVAFSRGAARQYVDTRTTICGLSPDLCNVGKGREWMRNHLHSIEDGYWLLKKHSCHQAGAEDFS